MWGSSATISIDVMVSIGAGGDFKFTTGCWANRVLLFLLFSHILFLVGLVAIKDDLEHCVKVNTPLFDSRHQVIS